MKRFLLCLLAALPFSCMAQTLRLSKADNQTIVLEASGEPGSYRLEASADLQNWREERGSINLLSFGWQEVASVFIESSGRFFRLALLSRRLQILTHPENATPLEGEAFTLSVTASGDPPLVYQWFRDGTAIAGATNASLRVTNTVPAVVGIYTVSVTSRGASVTSLPGIVSMVPKPPLITTQPGGVLVQEGQSFSLRVAALGTAPLAYQWFRNEVPITGATGTVYAVTGATAASAGAYTARVTSGTGGVITSQTAIVTIPAKWAPVSLQGLTIRVRSSTAGPFRWIASPRGTNYLVFPESGQDGSRGTYSYSRTENDQGRLALTDYQDGNIEGTIAFSSATNGVVTAGRFSGAFSVESSTLEDAPMAVFNLAGRILHAAIIEGRGGLSPIGGWRAVIDGNGMQYSLTALGYAGDSIGLLTYRRLSNSSASMTLVDSRVGSLDGSVVWFSSSHGELSLKNSFGGWQQCVFRLQ